MDATEQRMIEAAAKLSDRARYMVLRDAGSNTPCQIEGCPLSQEEHHRLAYGILAENRDLKRRIGALEHGERGDAARAACDGCQLPYGGPGWCDIRVPNEVWVRISPTGDAAGFLCFNCITERVRGIGLEDVPLMVMSGPWGRVGHWREGWLP